LYTCFPETTAMTAPVALSSLRASAVSSKSAPDKYAFDSRTERQAAEKALALEGSPHLVSKICSRSIPIRSSKSESLKSTPIAGRPLRRMALMLPLVSYSVLSKSKRYALYCLISCPRRC